MFFYKNTGKERKKAFSPCQFVEICRETNTKSDRFLLFDTKRHRTGARRHERRQQNVSNTS